MKSSEKFRLRIPPQFRRIPNRTKKYQSITSLTLVHDHFNSPHLFIMYILNFFVRLC